MADMKLQPVERRSSATAGGWRVRNNRRAWRRDSALLLLAAPALLYLFIFKYLTMFGTLIAFKRYRVADGILGSPWVGLDNFRFLFGTGQIWNVIRNTLLLNLLFLPCGTIVALAVAIFIHELYTSRFTRFYQTTLFFPQFISWVLVSYFVYALLSTENGVINQWLRTQGLTQSTGTTRRNTRRSSCCSPHSGRA